MSDSEAHNGAAEVSDTIESQQQQQTATEHGPAQPVEHKPEDKTGTAEPEQAEQPQEPKDEEEAEKDVASSEGNKDDDEPDKEYLNQVAEEMANEVFDEIVHIKRAAGGPKADESDHSEEKKGESKFKAAQADIDDEEKMTKDVCVITSKSDCPNEPVQSSTSAMIETPEVSSTRNDDLPPSKPVRSSRRGSYVSNRGYAPGYQNYGLAYLPYKSNFEPSEEARRRADEFFKTFKL